MAGAAVDPAGNGADGQNLRDEADLVADQAAVQHGGAQVVNFIPRLNNRLSPFTVGCLIMNKTIGCDIFTQPYNVVSVVGNPAAVLLLWIAVALILEYIFKVPDFFISCVYGMTFFIFRNLAGNAIQFGVYMQTAINPNCQEGCMRSGPVVGWALGVLILCALINIITPKGSILINNLFAVLKVSLVIIMIFLGIGWSLKWGALTFAIYPLTGFEQPFYVLAEVRQPKTLFVPTVMSTMALILVLNPLINTSYFCVHPYQGSNISSGPNSLNTTNAAINFFWTISGGRASDGGQGLLRGASVLFALSIFGNLLAVIYTAPRVKQEIAKEGILPKSLFFAPSKDSLLSRLFTRNPADREQEPIAATALHLMFEIILVLSVGLSLAPGEAYNTLTYLYTYVITGILGFLAVVGLLYLKVDAGLKPQTGCRWNQKREYRPMLDPLPCIVAVISLGLVLFGAFAKTSVVVTDAQPGWLKPAVRWCRWSLEVIWWLGIELRQWKGQYQIRRERITYVEAVDDADPVQRAEMMIVEKEYSSQHHWPVDNLLQQGH
ncbi:amino acid permease-domain-containing protein [Lasiosphaeria ovina]|uniref:Amino acid permease-domain-containing protein n=1 Tax=Lasiosphaeria ovina TaxID=92902 RepID=A0AAE0KBD6_9PEZI|nr:amino acid permease-domain-containing protein [Lasiosphaeria ovina]